MNKVMAVVECDHNWSGGNDYMNCSKCGFEFDYRFGWKTYQEGLKKLLIESNDEPGDKFTKDKPKTPGWYWAKHHIRKFVIEVKSGEYMPDEWFDLYAEWREDSKQNPDLARIPYFVGVYVEGGDTSNDTCVDDLDWEWCGPISEPD